MALSDFETAKDASQAPHEVPDPKSLPMIDQQFAVAAIITPRPRNGYHAERLALRSLGLNPDAVDNATLNLFGEDKIHRVYDGWEVTDPSIISDDVRKLAAVIEEADVGLSALQDQLRNKFQAGAQ